jgi:hypothetical protein
MWFGLVVGVGTLELVSRPSDSALGRHLDEAGQMVGKPTE